MQFNLSKSLLASVLLGASTGKSSARLAANTQRKLDGNGSVAVVANRAAGSVSFIPEDGNFECDDVITVHVGGSEPMYVNVNEDEIFVGDRSRNVVMIFDPKDILNPTDIAVDNAQCEGLFHQWLNDKYLVATCTVTSSIVVLKLSDRTLSYIALDNLGGCVPHDIVINERDEIFVTTLGDCENQIIKIDAKNGEEEGRIDVGNGVDPHVALYPRDQFLYSPQQDGGTVAVYRQNNLAEVQSLVVPNAHGVCFSPNGDTLFVTDINGADSPGRRLIEITPRKGGQDATLTGAAATVTEVGAAHNCAVTPSGKIFVTHSGPVAQAVTLFEKDGNELENVGFYLSDPYASNPFGLAIYNGDIEMA